MVDFGNIFENRLTMSCRRQPGAFNESQRSFGVARRHEDLVEGKMLKNTLMIKVKINAFDYNCNTFNFSGPK